MFRRLAFQEGVAVQIIYKVAPVVVRARSSESDTSHPIHPELLHSSKDVFYSDSDATDCFVGLLLGFTQGRVALAFAH